METTVFDFDEWVALAKTAPEDFEQRRRQCLDAVILRNGDSCRLKAMQCRIDLERVRARTPIKACIRIYGLMWDSFLHMDETLVGFLLSDLRDVNAPIPHTRQAKLLTFRPRY